MKKSEFLRAAVRGHLVDRTRRDIYDIITHSEFVCNALGCYRRALGYSDEAKELEHAIEFDIKNLLEGHITVIGWLHETLKWPPGYWPTQDEQYKYRLRWAEHMAQEYEAQGD